MAQADFWNGRKVVVTGAGGFIGSHLCQRLVELGAQVTALLHYDSRSGCGNLEFLPKEKLEALQVVAGNVEDSGFVHRLLKGQSVVFHLAALIAIPYSYDSPLSYVRTNVEGTLNILEGARTHGLERVVHTSTSETYGTALYTPIDEKHPLQGQSPYSASKIGADKLAESYYCSFELPVVTLRPFNTYGPRQSARAVIPTIISQALARPEVQLGALDPVRDLNFVSDTVSSFVKVAESEAAIGKVLNSGSGRGVSIGDLATTILKLMDLDKRVVLDEKRLRPAKSEVLELVCCSQRLRDVVGWSPDFTLEQGLAETIEFVRQTPEFYRPAEYTI